MTRTEAFTYIVGLRVVLEQLDPKDRIELIDLLMDGYCKDCGTDLKGATYCTCMKDD